MAAGVVFLSGGVGDWSHQTRPGQAGVGGILAEAQLQAAASTLFALFDVTHHRIFDGTAALFGEKNLIDDNNDINLI